MSNLQAQDKKDPKRLPVVIRTKILFGAAFLFPFNLYQTRCLSSICDLPRNTSIVKKNFTHCCKIDLFTDSSLYVDFSGGAIKDGSFERLREAG